MGRVLADVAAYEEEPRRLIFTCLFSSLFFVCAFLCRVMYYIPGRTHSSTKEKHCHGKLPPKLVLTIPWKALCVDLIGPYTIRGKDGTVIEFICV